MQTVTLADAQERLLELVRHAQKGEEIVIVQENAPSVKLVLTTRPGYGALQGRIQMADDFDAPLLDFAEYMP